ncbi:MAG: fatty acid--CoA ligase [Anaerolineales bacterium]
MHVPLTPLEFRQRAVSLYGSKVGIVDEEKRFTYAEYDHRVNRFANALTKLGVGPGEVVSFITFNSHQLLEAYYAVPQIGAILNPINIRLSHHEMEYILNHAETRVLCFHQEFLTIVETMRDKLPGVEHYIILEPEDVPDWSLAYEALLDEVSPVARIDLDTVDENAVVELFYTSGTTGPPKGVTITNRTLYIHTLSAIHGFQASEEDTLLHVVPLFHVNGWGTPQFLTAVGGKHVILRKLDFGEMLRLIEQEKVTKILGVPTIFNGMLQHPDLKKYDMSSLVEVVIGGAPSSLSLIEEIEAKIGCRAYGGYGLTETTPFITIARPKRHLKQDRLRLQACQVKTGIPNIGVRLRVVDEDGNDIPSDEKSIGEIVVRGNHVMHGYLKDPEATDEVIVDGWFHTGDMAVIDNEGYITIVDRKKDIIISGGENISSVEVEKVIRNHPAVFETIVIGVPHEKWGEVPKALVVLKPGEKASEEDIISHVREHLANYKAPKSVEFKEGFPKGGTGKILKRELREPYWVGFEKRIH